MFLINNETQQMCDKAILEFGRTLKSVPNRLLQIVPDCYKNQEMCNKAVDNYRYALEFVPKCYKIQNICDNTYRSTMKFVPDSLMS